LKAVFIIPNLSTGGIQTQVTLLAKSLIRNDKVTSVLVVGVSSENSNYSQSLKDLGIEVLFNPQIGEKILSYDRMNLWNKLVFWFQMIAWIRSLKPSVIFPYTAKIDNVINVIWRLSNARMSFSFERNGHIESKKEKSKWTGKIKKWSKPIYVSNSRHGAESMSKIKSIALENIQVIPNGLSPLIGGSSSIDSVIKLKIDTNKVVFLMIANFFDQKDHQFVLHAWKAGQVANSQLLIAGKGNGANCLHNYQEAVQFVEEHQLSNQIKFLGEVNDTNAFLEIADAGVLSSTTEGCPNAVLEYMSAGLPVISRDIPGVREVLPNENLKYLSGFDDTIEFAKNMQYFEQNALVRDEIGEANKKYVNEHFSVKKMVESYHKILFN
jgi:glycosyltransferase involved in cell wall biosynthesis